MIRLNQWVYDRGYMTTPMGVRASEISGICEINDPYRNHSGSVITTKNGEKYEVKEDVNLVLSMMDESDD